MSGEFFQYQTRGAAFVPLAMRCQTRVLGFDYCPDVIPSRSQLSSAQSFLSRYPNAKMIFVHQGEKTAEKIKERVYRMPLENLLFF